VEVELDRHRRPKAVLGGGEPGGTGAAEPGPALAAGSNRYAVEAIGEVWRVDDEWWRQPISRRYFDVVLQGGKHVVLFEDLTTHQWWMQQP
jgi:hypothetical protein